MGQVLSAPVSSKFITRKSARDVRVGTCEMQGYRLNMEDAMSVKLGLNERFPRHCFAGVFDGHAGTQASLFLERTLADRVSELKDPTNPEQLKQCVMAVDAEFLQTSSPEIKEHGSTCVFAVFYPNHDDGEKDETKRSWNIVVSNVGDSRAMIVRKNGVCVSLTTDHKPEDAHEEQRIQQAGGTVSSNRVDGQLAMSRAIGDYQYKANPNLTVAEQKVVPIPDITTGVAYQGDRLFICCDGIVEQMTNEDAAACIHENMPSIDSKCDPATIIPPVFELSLQRGSKDNMSGVLIAFGPDGFGSGYSTESNFLPGPFSAYARDETFFNAYRTDALKHGVAEGEWLALAQAVPCPQGAPAPGPSGRQQMQALLGLLQGQIDIQTGP